MERGQSSQIRLIGEPGTLPLRAWCDDEELLIRLAETGDTLTVTAMPDARQGLRWIRLYNADGAAALKPFFVGVLRESPEQEPNDTCGDAQQQTLPVVVNGVLSSAGEVDTLQVSIHSGRTLIASVEANRSLRSPMDGVLQLVSESGFVVAQNDDHHGFDPQIVYTATRTGTYYVRLFAFPVQPNSSIRFAGAADYVYRLTLTDGPFVDHVFPERTDVFPSMPRAVGWNLDRANELPTELPGTHTVRPIPVSAAMRQTDADAAGERFPAVFRRFPGCADDTGAADFTERTVGRDSPPVLQPPALICGHLAVSGERDRYRFVAAGADSLRLSALSRAFDAPLDAVLRLYDDEGELICESDDGSRDDADPSLVWTVPDDGEFLVEVSDRFAHGGPEYVYLLSVARAAPRLALSTDNDHYTLNPGQALTIRVNVDRLNGFADNVTIGATSLPKGITANAVVSTAEGEESRAVELELVSDGSSPFSGPIRITGAVAASPQRFAASAAVAPAGYRTSVLWLTVTAQPDANTSQTKQSD